MKKTYDAIVVGARVAGSPTAMLLARQGYDVLLVDRATFPSDTLSTHLIHIPAIVRMKRWGVLDRVLASGVPAISEVTFDFGPFELAGMANPVEGIADTYCIRRHVLDNELVNAAAEAGVEVRTGFLFKDLVIEDGQVVGITGRDSEGNEVTERARIVIGADGMNSKVARIVGAEEYNVKPPLSAAYYSYFSGTGIQDTRIYDRERRVIGVQQTNDGMVNIFVQIPNDEFGTFKKDIDGNFFRALEMVDGLAEAVRAGKREEPYKGAGNMPNFFRKPWGPGWALVGDAGYHKDPTLGHGVMDAFIQAEFLSQQLGAAFRGHIGINDALAAYQQQRDDQHIGDYELVTAMADIGSPPSQEMQELIPLLLANPEARQGFFDVLCGVMKPQAFFAPENMARYLPEPVAALAA